MRRLGVVCNELISKAESLLVELVNALKTGVITVSETKKPMQRSKCFLNLFKSQDDQQSSQKITRMLKRIWAIILEK